MNINPIVNDAARRCKTLARQLGGDVKVIDHLKFNSKLVPLICPFSNNLGINWEKKIVYISKAATIFDVSGMIHEMGHVFACAKKPSLTKEYEFFGWEYATATKLGLLFIWNEGSENYALIEDGGKDWGDLSAEQKDSLIQERLSYAIKKRMVSKNFIPLTIR